MLTVHYNNIEFSKADISLCSLCRILFAHFKNDWPKGETFASQHLVVVAEGGEEGDSVEDVLRGRRQSKKEGLPTEEIDDTYPLQRVKWTWLGVVLRTCRYVTNITDSSRKEKRKTFFEEHSRRFLLFSSSSDPASSYIAHRPIASDVAGDVVGEKIMAWLTDCKTVKDGHYDCHKGQLTNPPTRAIDVSDSSCGPHIHIASQASRLATWLSTTVGEVPKENT